MGLVLSLLVILLVVVLAKAIVGELELKPETRRAVMVVVAVFAIVALFWVLLLLSGTVWLDAPRHWWSR